jgi:hypothetical protein
MPARVEHQIDQSGGSIQMTDRRTIEIGRYRGPATLTDEADQRIEVHVDLHHMREQLAARSMEGTEWLDGLESWSGSVAPPPMMPGMYRIEMPDGQTGDALMRNNHGTLVGSGPAPF